MSVPREVHKLKISALLHQCKLRKWLGCSCTEDYLIISFNLLAEQMGGSHSNQSPRGPHLTKNHTRGLSKIHANRDSLGIRTITVNRCESGFGNTKKCVLPTPSRLLPTNPSLLNVAAQKEKSSRKGQRTRNKITCYRNDFCEKNTN